MKDYVENIDVYDYGIAREYGRRRFEGTLISETVEDALKDFHLTVSYFLQRWDYELTTLYNTTKLTYDPIVNNFLRENRTTTRTPNLTHTDNISNSSEAFTDTVSTSNSVSPFDSNDYVNQSKVITDNVNDPRKSSSISNRTETGNEIVEENSSREGNLGTMTSQEMIREEREIAKFDFYKYLFDRIMNETTMNIYC